MRKISISLLACLLTLGMVAAASAQTETQGSAKVVRIKGDARYRTATSDWRPLKVGTVLNAGAIVQTGKDKDSFVDLVLHDGGSMSIARPASFASTQRQPTSTVGYSPRTEQNSLRICGNTALGIDKLTSTRTGADVVSDTQLDLKSGRVMGNVKKMSAMSRYEIKLPNGVAGIRGTFFDLTSEGVCRVMEGSVVLAYLDANNNAVTQLIKAAQQFDSSTGLIIEIPAALMPELQRVINELGTTSPGGPRVGQSVGVSEFSYDHTVSTASPHGADSEQ